MIEEKKSLFSFLERVYLLEAKEENGKTKYIAFDTFDELNRIIKEQPLGVAWEYGYRYHYDENPMLFKNLEEVKEFLNDLEELSNLEDDYYISSTIKEDYIINSKEDYLKNKDYDITFFSSIGKYTYQDQVVRFQNQKSKENFESYLDHPVLKRKIS